MVCMTRCHDISFPKRRNEMSVEDDVWGDAEHLSDDRKHLVVRNTVTMTEDTKGESEQCRLTADTPMSHSLRDPSIRRDTGNEEMTCASRRSAADGTPATSR